MLNTKNNALTTAVYQADKARSVGRIFTILVAQTLIFTAVFLLWGLNARNYAYNLNNRSTKLLAILVVSLATGFSSVSFQTITNNKILTPSVMGLDSLYLFIQTFVVFFMGSGKLQMMSAYSEFFISVGIMMVASWLIFSLMFRGEGQNIYFIVLAGIIIGNFFDGLSGFMQVILDPNEYDVLQTRMYASFNNINDEMLGICIIILVLMAILIIPDLKRLDVLHLGMVPAINLGINYKAITLRTLMIIAVLVSISTVLTGPMAFLSIIVVSLSRQLLPSFKHRDLTLAAALISYVALVLGLIVTERLFKFQTQVSTIINFIGGIYFIYLVIKEAGNDIGKKHRKKVSG